VSVGCLMVPIVDLGSSAASSSRPFRPCQKRARPRLGPRARLAAVCFTDLVGMPPSTYRRHAARDGGMPSCVDQPGVEKRRAPCRTHMTAMDITIHGTFLPRDDPDAPLAFSNDTLGFQVRNDVGFSAMRCITVAPAGPPGTSIVLEALAADPVGCTLMVPIVEFAPRCSS